MTPPRKSMSGDHAVGTCFTYARVGVMNPLCEKEEVLAQKSYGTDLGPLGR